MSETIGKDTLERSTRTIPVLSLRQLVKRLEQREKFLKRFGFKCKGGTHYALVLDSSGRCLSCSLLPKCYNCRLEVYGKRKLGSGKLAEKRTYGRSPHGIY